MSSSSARRQFCLVEKLPWPIGSLGAGQFTEALQQLRNLSTWWKGWYKDLIQKKKNGGQRNNDNRKTTMFEDESPIKNGDFCCYHISFQGCNTIDTMYMSRSHIIHIISQYILVGRYFGYIHNSSWTFWELRFSRLSASCPLHSVPLSFHQFSLKIHGSNEFPWNQHSPWK